MSSLHHSQAQSPVIVVESEIRLHAVLAQTLPGAGEQVGHLPSASACLQNLQDATYLVDLMLEDMDGLSLIEDIRAGKPFSPIIAFLSEQPGSSLGLQEYTLREMAAKSGANALFVAPFNLGEIVSTISRLATPCNSEAIA